MSGVRGARLRAVSEHDVVQLDAWASDPAAGSEFSDFGLPPRSHAELLARAGLETGYGFLVVEVGGHLAGSVSWHAVGYGPNPQSRAWNIGIELHPDFRGQGFGTQAQKLLVGMLFATTDAERVEASTDVTNLAEQRCLEKAGFTCEGILRAAQWRRGVWHDLVSYSRLRSDPRS